METPRAKPTSFSVEMLQPDSLSITTIISTEEVPGTTAVVVAGVVRVLTGGYRPETVRDDARPLSRYIW